MKQINVGSINGYDVLFLPEKQLVFCKNTVLPLKTLKTILFCNLDRIEIPEKNLTIRKTMSTIDLGCLTVSIEDYKKMYQLINRINEK